MTDQGTTDTQAERIRRLQERRAGSTPTRSTQARSTQARSTQTRGGKRKRRHPAAASRVLLAGLSLTSFFTIGGSLVLAGNNQSAVVQSVSAPATSAASATPVTGATPVTKALPSAPRAHTTTRGS